MSLRDLAQRAAKVALIPLSVVPLVISVPHVEDEYETFSERYLERERLPAPAPGVSPAEARRWRPVEVPDRRVPVLAYHGIDGGGPFSVDREAFAHQMAMLDRAGFEAISIERFVRFLRGERVRLPERPVLLTFDDGRLDSFRGADAVLERHGFRATMFAVTREAGRTGSFYSSWDELRAMAESGRWDIQLHAGDGHVQVPVDGRGERGPFYANRIHRPGDRVEPFAEARDRIVGDLVHAEQRMREEIPGFRPLAFAVPFGDYGRHATNDRRIPRMLEPWLAHQFDAVFVQASDPPFARPEVAHERVQRFEVTARTSTDELYEWLCRCAVRGAGPSRTPRR